MLYLLKKEEENMLNFITQKDALKTYSKQKKDLKNCPETLKLLESENESNNPYITLARVFRLYNQGATEKHFDWYFYKYLQTLEKKDQYTFSCREEEITIAIDIFNPFITINKKELINPQWHLIISYYAHIDAVVNHDDNIYVKKMKAMPGYKEPKQWRFNCKSLKKWIEEAF